MVYADSVAEQRDYDLYYETLSKYEDMRIAIGGGYTDSDQQRFADTAEVITRHAAVDDTVLDIGCANGGLLTALSCRGFSHLTGLDPSSACVEHIRQRGIAGITGKLSEVTAEAVGRYRMIVLSHVLEHVYDVATAMTRISSLLTEAGKVYVEVPDATRYHAFYTAPFHYFDVEHINHFDGEALGDLAQRHRLEVIESGEKTIPVAEGVIYPAVYAILRRSEKRTWVVKDRERCLEERIEAYIARSREDGRLQKIEAYASSGQPLILWGAGSYAQRLLADSRLRECNIRAIVDNDPKKQGKRLDCYVIQEPSAVRELDGTILVVSAVYAKEIAAEIATGGLDRAVDIL